jgi:hypothetical protein
MCSGYVHDFQHLGYGGRERNLQLKIKRGELWLHDCNDGLKGRYFFPFTLTLDQVLQPNAEFDIAGFEPVR